jgi:hypothetical protein
MQRYGHNSVQSHFSYRLQSKKQQDKTHKHGNDEYESNGSSETFLRLY